MTNRAAQTAAQEPMRLVYAGLALFLGGCVLTGMLAAFTENSGAIGFAFLCSMPIGFILCVVGIIMAISRREGRRLNEAASGTARTGRRTSDRW